MLITALRLIDGIDPCLWMSEVQEVCNAGFMEPGGASRPGSLAGSHGLSIVLFPVLVHHVAKFGKIYRIL